ncbi:MBL fold metallo-hydrolase [Tindallia californiensis]|uniref:Phosphoribosyl 1,2-cyclic phosphodiesterase n=1 Tax=Tindallia californiensis TaxID=159292 RepID=A0A1H3QIE1_9FIRM|nr:MBL fold metallo-hydrolase [Tindallia californiensis]SDZ13063.1 Phosphoribosyl 1,2-cyclic phosphodiesterase [Tindallia californiensis]
MPATFCTLASGSSGNCHVLSDGNQQLLIDAGLSGKQIQSRLQKAGMQPENLSGILVSHEHSDHIKGAGILSRRFQLPIYANEKTWIAMEEKIGPVKPEHRKIFDSQKAFAIGDISVTPYRLSHDAADPVGFALEGHQFKICLATDLGHVPESLYEVACNSDLLVMESNHDVDMLNVGSYPYYLKRRVLSDQGHLSNESAGQAVVEMIRRNVKSILLAHLSRENNFPELAYSTVTGIMAEKGMKAGKDVNLSLSTREEISCLYAY